MFARDGAARRGEKRGEKRRGRSWRIVKFEITPFGLNGGGERARGREGGDPLARNLHETAVRDLARKWQ